MEIKLKINTDKILAETGITIDEPEQWLALMQDGLDYFKFHNISYSILQFNFQNSIRFSDFHFSLYAPNFKSQSSKSTTFSK